MAENVLSLNSGMPSATINPSIARIMAALAMAQHKNTLFARASLGGIILPG
jgi:hypothetical protein